MGLCDDLKVWDGGVVGGRSKVGRIYVYRQLIHSTVQQKLAQPCKAIILQFGKKKKNDFVTGTDASSSTYSVLSNLFPITEKQSSVCMTKFCALNFQNQNP